MGNKILMMGPLPAEQSVRLEKDYSVLKLWKEKDPETTLNEMRQEVVGMVSIYGQNISGKLIHALPNLEIIAQFGVGYDNIDLEAAKEQEVTITNTPDVLTDDTADLAIGLVLGVFRRMVEGDIYVRAGLWGKRGEMPLGRSLKGKVMGIVGLGRIGQAIARRAEVFGMNVIYHGPSKKEEVPYAYYDDLYKMVEDCDVLMLSCSYSEVTHHLVNAKLLKRLGKDGVLVNIARGKIVCEQDLIDALEGGVIAGAGLDVFENEPDVPSAFSHLDNVVLQPHRGSATIETRASMANLVIDNLDAYFEKAQPLTPINLN